MSERLLVAIIVESAVKMGQKNEAEAALSSNILQLKRSSDLVAFSFVAGECKQLTTARLTLIYSSNQKTFLERVFYLSGLGNTVVQHKEHLLPL